MENTDAFEWKDGNHYSTWGYRHHDGGVTLIAQNPERSRAELSFTDDGALLHADMDGGFNEVDVLVPWHVLDVLRAAPVRRPDGVERVEPPSSL